MTETLKDKLIDLLFEKDPPKEETRPQETKPVKRPEPEVSPIKAEDLLYDRNKGHEKKSGTFINYNEPDRNKEEEIMPVDYSPTPNLSPIFGPLDAEKKSRDKKDVKADVDYASTEKPKSSPLGTVMSPIFGYDSKKANELRDELREEEKKEEIEDFDITEDLGDIFAGDEYKQETEENETVAEEIDLFSDFYTFEDK